MAVKINTRQPIALGPLERITNVHWSQGFFVEFFVHCRYVTGTPSSRSVEINFTPEGLRSGGKLLGLRRFSDIAGEDTFRALLQFSSPLKEATSAFFVKLIGSLTVTDTTNPGVSGDEFCGALVTTWTSGPVYVIDLGGPGTTLAQDVTYTESSPAGTTGGTFTNFPLSLEAGLEAVGTGSRTTTSIIHSIWYPDSFGNLIDTHRPCEELQPPGTPQFNRRIEGFDAMRARVTLRQGYTAKTVDAWTINNALLEQADPTKGLPGPVWQVEVPKPQVGLNSDFLPIFDELGDDNYGFRNANLAFAQFPSQKAFVGTYLMMPARLKYGFIPATKDPYGPHFPIPPTLTYGAGIPPLGTTTFS
jgi:hypothetical protein